jgi:prepilin signal peptidase PulO-like enzyme (type II secretory pathway)
MEVAELQKTFAAIPYPVLKGMVGFVVGIILGSFVTALSHRVPRGLSIISPASFCPTCQKSISTIDLVPIASWVLNAGKCSKCSAPIPGRYPLIELLSGILAACMAITQPLDWPLLLNLALLVFGTSIAVIDLENGERSRGLLFLLLLVVGGYIALTHPTMERPVAYAIGSFVVGLIAAINSFQHTDDDQGLWPPLIPIALGAAWFEANDLLYFLSAVGGIAALSESLYISGRLSRRYLLASLTLCWLIIAAI